METLLHQLTNNRRDNYKSYYDKYFTYGNWNEYASSTYSRAHYSMLMDGKHVIMGLEIVVFAREKHI